MGIRVGADNSQVITLEDVFQGIKITITYRPATAQEYVRVQSRAFTQGEGGKVYNTSSAEGLAILPDLVKGIEFPEMGKAIEWEKDGEWVVLSSTPGEPGYREDWYQVLSGPAIKILGELAARLLGTAGILLHPNKKAKAEPETKGKGKGKGKAGKAQDPAGEEAAPNS